MVIPEMGSNTSVKMNGIELQMLVWRDVKYNTGGDWVAQRYVQCSPTYEKFYIMKQLFFYIYGALFIWSVI